VCLAVHFARTHTHRTTTLTLPHHTTLHFQEEVALTEKFEAEMITPNMTKRDVVRAQKKVALRIRWADPRSLLSSFDFDFSLVIITCCLEYMGYILLYPFICFFYLFIDNKIDTEIECIGCK
jgi:hypothetical protein